MNSVNYVKEVAAFSVLIFLLGSAAAQDPQSTDLPNPDEQPSSYGTAAQLPLPSTRSVKDYESVLFKFLNDRQYVQLGWTVDKSVRDTGPWISGKYYGTHPAVRIYYSPEIMKWLVNGRTEEIPDGAMMIKEQYHPPAARYEGMGDDALWDSLMSWTVMIKDRAGSHDGWFWSNPGKGQEPVDSLSYPFEEPISGFGLYCVRCHGSAQSPGRGQPGMTNEYTFASLRNIKGFPGEPLLFRVDDSWRQEEKESEQPEAKESDPAIEVASKDAQGAAGHPRCTDAQFPERCQPQLNQAFLDAFPGIAQIQRDQVLHLPPITVDGTPRLPVGGGGETQRFVTSGQCMSCHAGITEPFGPSMFLPTTKDKGYGAPGLHVSPYGEWRFTPMGLAGRDPIFFAQLDSEMALIDAEFEEAKAGELKTQLAQTCLSCHGVMGKRQHDIDQHEGAFGLSQIYSIDQDPSSPGYANAHYGALARDGISCTVCHQMQPRVQPESESRPYLQHFLATSITGNFLLGDKAEIYGPFKDNEIAPYAMEHALGYKPKHNAFIQSSQMCGTCHTVNLPILDRPLGQSDHGLELIEAEPNPVFKQFQHHVEQATYLEWLNSGYENEFNPDNAKAQSCQDCHMSRGVVDKEAGIELAQLETRIAAIQDPTYPDAENLAPHKDLTVRVRKEGYRRHNFRGLNAFMLEMFNQFDDILGVRRVDYMTGSSQDVAGALRDFQRQATTETADLAVSSHWGESPGTLVATVKVTNKVGHRFPSGVGFRRAFVELTVEGNHDGGSERKLLWSSGRTNSIGQIIGPTDQPLKTEFFDREEKTKSQQYQPHYQEITHQDQVQIYETLLCDSKQQLTTSFVRGSNVIKDNRFLPWGWRAEGPDPSLTGEFLKATHPGPRASQDADYKDGSGTDKLVYRMQLPKNVNPESVRIRVRLFYQAIPPYFLKNLFDTAPDSKAVQRLHHLCSNMKLDDTIIKDWKLLVTQAESQPAE